ncbi:hypothetical protein GGI35DRAFT_451423 [Trichoderma velutinum]
MHILICGLCCLANRVRALFVFFGRYGVPLSKLCQALWSVQQGQLNVRLVTRRSESFLIARCSKEFMLFGFAFWGVHCIRIANWNAMKCNFEHNPPLR